MNQTKNVPNNRRMETITGFLKPIIIYELLDDTTPRHIPPFYKNLSLTFGIQFGGWVNN